MTLTVLDPQTRAMLDKAETAGTPAWNAVPIDHARTLFLQDAMANVGKTMPLAAVDNVAIPGPGDDFSNTVPARLYVPNTEQSPRPTLLYVHGGGFALGALDSHDAICRHISAKSGVQVLSIAYRLAPEHPFPAGLDDVMTAARWLVAHHEAIGADPERLAIGGDSAGANLAATACRMLHTPGKTPFRHQMLLYPMVDLRMQHPSIEMFGDGYRLTRDVLRWFVDSYVRDAQMVEDPRVSPLLADDLTRLPPTLVLTAGFDPLRDEGQAYANSLTHAGVACEHVCFEDMIHGFCNRPGTIARAHDALTLVADRLKAALFLRASTSISA